MKPADWHVHCYGLSAVSTSFGKQPSATSPAAFLGTEPTRRLPPPDHESEFIADFVREELAADVAQ